MSSSQETPILSIIIPAYNEENRLTHSLDSITQFVEDNAATYNIEVIIVNNNSKDATPEIAREYAARFPYITALDEPRQGKGAAVRTGIMAGRGEYLFACDADLSMPIEEVLKFLPPQLDGYDIAIASREVEGSRRVDEPEYRHLMGRVFNLIVRVLAIPRIHDTQCGFKSFRRDVAYEIFPLQTIDGWGFDVEVLFIALKQGYKLSEVPITWYYMPQSRISPLKDSLSMLVEVLKVRWNGLRGLYGPR